MLDWHSCQICYPLEIKILLLLFISQENGRKRETSNHPQAGCIFLTCRPIVQSQQLLSQRKFAFILFICWRIIPKALKLH